MVKNKYVCEYCKKEFIRKSNLEMHELTCNGEGKKHKNIDNSSINCSNGKHDLVMLNPNIESNRRALNLGFSAVCRKCKELV